MIAPDRLSTHDDALGLQRALLRARSLPNSRFCLKSGSPYLRGRINEPSTCGDGGCHNAPMRKPASVFKQKRQFESERGSDFARRGRALDAEKQPSHPNAICVLNTYQCVARSEKSALLLPDGRPETCACQQGTQCWASLSAVSCQIFPQRRSKDSKAY